MKKHYLELSHWISYVCYLIGVGHLVMLMICFPIQLGLGVLYP